MVVGKAKAFPLRTPLSDFVTIKHCENNAEKSANDGEPEPSVVAARAIHQLERLWRLCVISHQMALNPTECEGPIDLFCL